MAADAHPSSDLHGGIALAVAALAALLVANSPLGPSYEALLHVTGEIRIGSIGLAQSLVHWINDGLMAIFFLLIGIEIKREVFAGALASPRKAALPAIAAFGGFVVPALTYAALNFADPLALRGWAVPAATDIAFALGICALLGRAVPASLKTFLLALAIIDDLMAIVVIALFYTAELSGLSLALAGLGIASLLALNRLDVRSPAPYLIIGIFTWICVLKSGVHATLAGVAVGLALPMTAHEGESLLDRVEHALTPWVNCVIIPVFAFANAGVSLAGVSLASLTASIPLGIAAGLFLGKQVGVFLLASWAVWLGIADRPKGATPLQLYGIALLTGVGFTMSLFIGTLAFEDEATMVQIRLGVLLGSLLSALAACAVLLAAARRPAAPSAR
jgi:NhaA family Na+:H+ antiporter